MGRRPDILSPRRGGQPAMLKFDWIQVEVTSYCNAMCSYCPHTVYRDSWINRHLDLDSFKKLVPSFSKTGLVFLQGWGEPLLHPHFFTMVARAKEAGCLVGTTTNGTLVDAVIAKEVVLLGIDILAFSLAGIEEEHDKWRPCTTYYQVLEAINEVAAVKRQYRSVKPDIHVAYMLLRSGLEKLYKLPSWLQGRGIKQVVISTLDFIPSPELAGEALSFDEPKEFAKVKSLLDAVVQDGKKRGLDIHYYLTDWNRPRELCTENVLRSVFIGSDGSVAPCVFANLPVSGCPLRHTRSGFIFYQKLNFGNVNGVPLELIWDSIPYREFRASFGRKLYPICRLCPKLYAVLPKN